MFIMRMFFCICICVCVGGCRVTGEITSVTNVAEKKPTFFPWADVTVKFSGHDLSERKIVFRENLVWGEKKVGNEYSTWYWNAYSFQEYWVEYDKKKKVHFYNAPKS